MTNSEENWPAPDRLWAAIEQPDEASPKVLAWLEAHPHVKNMLERQLKLEQDGEQFAKEMGMTPEEFEKFLKRQIKRHLRDDDDGFSR